MVQHKLKLRCFINIYFTVLKENHIPELKTLHQMLKSDESFDTSTILAKLNSLDRRIEDVAKDGNCLFHAVADQLSNHPTKPIPITHVHLRQALVNFMMNYKPLLEVLT